MSTFVIFTLLGAKADVRYYKYMNNGRPAFGPKTAAFHYSDKANATRDAHQLRIITGGAYFGVLPAEERFGRKRLGLGPRPKPGEDDELRSALL